MSRGIIVYGASGSGTTTIGKELANILGFTHFDLDDYFWTCDTDIPYTKPHPLEERIKLLQNDIALCVRSLGYNLLHLEKEKITLFFQYLNLEPDWEKIHYYMLLDELF